MTLIDDFKARGLIQDIMPGTAEQLAKEVTSGYIGFDPTADSLHVGSLLPITILMRLQRAGHKPIALVGGATGMIGDPTGKSAERNLLDEETLAKNCAGIEAQLRKFLDFESAETAAEVVNNYDWFKDYSFLHFIRDAGKHISVNYMMSKDSVKKRLEFGLSFTEFSYQLIQGYDYYWLNKHKGVKLQLGGADQWGNIVTGTELIRRIQFAERGEVTEDQRADAFAMTCPLITKSDGSKFGKSEGGNIWLDPAKTSPYQFFQFWLNLKDEDAPRMAYIFSFKPVEAIQDLIAEHNSDPGKRLLQQAMAEEMTILVHSQEDYEFAVQASKILFSGNIEGLRKLSEEQLLDIMDGIPQVKASRETLAEGLNLINFLAENGVIASKGAARKLLTGGGISVNMEKATDPDASLTTEHLLNDRYILLQQGKRKFTLAIFE